MKLGFMRIGKVMVWEDGRGVVGGKGCIWKWLGCQLCGGGSGHVE